MRHDQTVHGPDLSTALFCALLIVFALIPLSSIQTESTVTPPNPIVENLPPDLPSLGDGSTTVIEFYNYDCSYCKEYFYENQENIQNAVEQNTITYYPIALFPDYTSESQKKILGSYCAAETLTTKQFFDYQNQVYASTKPKVDNIHFRNCIETQSHLISQGEQLFKDLAITTVIGSQALPTLVTKTQIYVGTHENYWDSILFPSTGTGEQLSTTSLFVGRNFFPAK